MESGSARVAWYWVPLVAYAILIYLLSSSSAPPIPKLDWPGFDKVLHAAEYGGFGALLFRALAMGGEGLSPRAALIAAVLVGPLYAATDEVHQLFVPARDSDPLDFAADCVGIVLGALAWRAAAFRGLRRPT